MLTQSRGAQLSKLRHNKRVADEAHPCDWMQLRMHTSLQTRHCTPLACVLSSRCSENIRNDTNDAHAELKLSCAVYTRTGVVCIMRNKHIMNFHIHVILFHKHMVHNTM